MSLSIKSKSFIALVLAASSLTGVYLMATNASPKIDITTVDEQKMVFLLPPLPYPYNAMEPYIDTKTMQIHHDRHHKAYVDNLNKAIKGTKWEGMTLRELFKEAHDLPTDIRNDAGAHWAHTFYWECMTGDKRKRVMPERLQDELKQAFGSVDKFKQEFVNGGLKQFGSGYVWLIRGKDGALKVTSTPNQDNPLMTDLKVQGIPLLTCDVWEHAYYLKYQNKRGDYLDAFWNVIDWDKVDKLVAETK